MLEINSAGMWPHVGDLDVHYPFSVRSADTVNITMGRYKKGKKNNKK